MAKVNDEQLGPLIREAFNLIVAKERGAERHKAAKQR